MGISERVRKGSCDINAEIFRMCLVQLDETQQALAAAEEAARRHQEEASAAAASLKRAQAEAASLR